MAKSILARVHTWRSAKGILLAALLVTPFGLYYVATNFSRQATTGLLGLFGLFMLIVILEK